MYVFIDIQCTSIVSCRLSAANRFPIFQYLERCIFLTSTFLTFLHLPSFFIMQHPLTPFPITLSFIFHQLVELFALQDRPLVKYNFKYYKYLYNVYHIVYSFSAFKVIHFMYITFNICKIFY
jgi:hypothetical protein